MSIFKSAAIGGEEGEQRLFLRHYNKTLSLPPALPRPLYKRQGRQERPAAAMGGAARPAPLERCLPAAAWGPRFHEGHVPSAGAVPPRGAFGSASLGSAAAHGGRPVSGGGWRGLAAPAPGGGAAAGRAGSALPRWGREGWGPEEHAANGGVELGLREPAVPLAPAALRGSRAQVLLEACVSWLPLRSASPCRPRDSPWRHWCVRWGWW